MRGSYQISAFELRIPEGKVVKKEQEEAKDQLRDFLSSLNAIPETAQYDEGCPKEDELKENGEGVGHAANDIAGHPGGTGHRGVLSTESR